MPKGKRNHRKYTGDLAERIPLRRIREAQSEWDKKYEQAAGHLGARGIPFGYGTSSNDRERKLELLAYHLVGPRVNYLPRDYPVDTNTYAGLLGYSWCLADEMDRSFYVPLALAIELRARIQGGTGHPAQGPPAKMGDRGDETETCR